MPAAGPEAHDGPIATINITPLVDIFLVLLIIFMITSTVIEERLFEVDLPKAAQAETQAPPAAGLYIDREARMFLDGAPADSARVTESLRERLAGSAGLQVLIGADQELAYREVIRAVDLVKGSGVKRYALKVVHAAP